MQNSTQPCVREVWGCKLSPWGTVLSYVRERDGIDIFLGVSFSGDGAYSRGAAFRRYTRADGAVEVTMSRRPPAPCPSQRAFAGVGEKEARSVCRSLALTRLS